VGLSQDFPPVPNSTMLWDRHLGLSPSGWYSGIIPICSTCIKQYSGHLGLNLSGWYSGIISGCSPCAKQYDGHLSPSGWYSGIIPGYLTCTNQYIGIAKHPTGHSAASLDNPLHASVCYGKDWCFFKYYPSTTRVNDVTFRSTHFT